MSSAVVAALAAPIREVQSLVGAGWSSDPFADSVAALGRVRDVLLDVSAAIRGTWQQTSAQWSGAGADGAADFTSATIAAVDELAAHADHMATTADNASAAVARANVRLRAIVDEFELRASLLEPHLESPAGAQQLLTEAKRSLAEAVTVVDELRSELDGHATAIASPTLSTPAPTAPAGVPSPAMPSMPPMGSGLGSSPPLDSLPGGGSGGLGGLVGDLVALSSQHAEVPDAAAFGDDVAVRLPDGNTAMAPNAVAADAVRHALTQLGVPYDWGGTTPGVGLDCSGLTQWAYHEAGLNLPRLAQEQDVGGAIDAGSLRPGDLAVWDGHVAMIVGNGTMIEAGDPVKLSPIRTENAGQGFQGFWRPTA
ncbi:MAG: peptidoglycan DL-endopeptidase CwlO [Mycobacterium sp.]|nr:peptidoglycan DL-endopeptidase CwlO [Mycobacterium sp.]